MKYDFETCVSRKGMGSGKWDSVLHSDGTPADVVPLSVADMEFLVAPEIRDSLIKAAEFGVYGYTGSTEEFADVVCDWMKRRHAWEVKSEWMIPTYGVVPAIYYAVAAFTKPGDKIILQMPVYYPFFEAIEEQGREILENPLKLVGGRYEMDFEDLERKAPSANLLVLCSPHNPVGRVWTREELIKLGEICMRNDIIVVSDEIHFDLIMEPHKHTVFASISEAFAEKSVICTAPSKTFSLAGLTQSNIFIKNDELRQRFLESTARAGAGFYNNYFGLAAAKTAYQKGEPWLSQLLPKIQENYDVLFEFFSENIPGIKLYPMEGTYLAWFDCKVFGLSDEELEKFMTDDAELFLDQGYIFRTGGEGMARINLACPTPVLRDALERLLSAVQKRGLQTE